MSGAWDQMCWPAPPVRGQLPCRFTHSSLCQCGAAVAILPGSVFSIEGDPQGFPIAKEIVGDLGGEFFFIDQKAKPLYHAGACVVSTTWSL